MNAQKTMIGFLLCSAVFLSGLLIFINTRESGSAYGKTYGIQGGNYTAIIARTESDSDALWMLKTDDSILMACQTDSKGRITVLAMADLQEVFSRAAVRQMRETPTNETEEGSAPVLRRRR